MNLYCSEQAYCDAEKTKNIKISVWELLTNGVVSSFHAPIFFYLVFRSHSGNERSSIDGRHNARYELE